MIKTITARNVNHALESGLHHLKNEGVITGSRNGPVLVAPGPVVTAYKKPMERVLWCPVRDANPFFHLFESMWMLAGRNDTATLTPLVPRMGMFSDDQKTLNGAYGYRWREHFGYDQLKEISKMLAKDPSTRRAVLSMWDPMGTPEEEGDQLPDLVNQGSKDLPCNTHIYFDASRGKLDMTVCNRSNDVIWGAYGANSVHMSFLHEWMALASGLEVGIYYQFSNNYHIYVAREDVQRLLYCPATVDRAHWRVDYQMLNEYNFAATQNNPRPLLTPNEWRAAHGFLDEMEEWCANGGKLTQPLYAFTQDVLNPVMQAHRLYKEGDTRRAVAALAQAKHSDWRTACLMWLNRRIFKHTNAGAVV